MASFVRRWSGPLLLCLVLGCSHAAPEWRPVVQPAAWAADRESTWFVQMADTQFGMYAKPLLFSYFGWPGFDDSFERETVNMELAVAHANRLHPDFVVVCGDLVNTPGHAGQIAEFERVAAQLDDSIPLYLVAGNHDVGNAPTSASLAAYRARFGPDWYSFRAGNVYGIVLDSSIFHSLEHVRDEEAAQLAWLEAELAKAKDSGAPDILVFQHHPFFLVDPDEEDQYFNIPRERRAKYLALLADAGVRAVLAGHYHRNAHGWADGVEMITTGPVGKPLGDDPSGLRIVRVGPDGLDHTYFGLESVPERVGAAAGSR